MINKLARILRNSGPARTLIPIGIVLIIFGSVLSGIISRVLIAAGVMAIILGVFQTEKAFKASRELDETTPGKGIPKVDFESFKHVAGVTEYYSRFDGRKLTPGYIIENAERNILYEAKMLKNSLIGSKTFEFVDHTTGRVREHTVGHVVTQRYNNEFFSAKSWFKFDEQNIWDILHERGLRMTTDLHSKLPYIAYDISMNGRAFARIETSSIYVHEEDAARHSIAVPYRSYYFRIWTDSNDFDLLFLTVFAISESEQSVVE